MAKRRPWPRLKTLPKGTFELTEEQDDGRIFNVKITITDTEFLVDLRDNPDQDAGPTNTSRDGTMICAQMIFKSLTDPTSPANEGSFRPLKVLTREGSVFHAKEPAAIGFYYEIEVRVYDLIWRCLAPHMPDRLPAGHFASICGTFIGGIHPDTGRQYTIIEPQIGGWGAWERATAIRASSPAFTVRPTTAPPKSPKRATGCLSTGWS